MTRITPRTCLYPLTGSLLLTFGLSIGLTFRSDHHCYAGTCGEWLFPLQARLHVVVWYSWIMISVVFFAVRAFQPRLRRFVQRRLFMFKLPLVGEQLAISALLYLDCQLIWHHRRCLVDSPARLFRGQGPGAWSSGGKPPSRCDCIDWSPMRCHDGNGPHPRLPA